MGASRGTNEMDVGFAITKFIDLGFGFAVGELLSSEAASCLLFDVALCTVCCSIRKKEMAVKRHRQIHKYSTNEGEDSVHLV